VQPRIEKMYVCREPISVRDRLYITLRFLTSGDSVNSLAYAYRVGRSIVTRIVQETCDAIWDTAGINDFLLRQWVRFPMTFRAAPQSFIGAIGAIDCTHINIIAPHEHEEAYVNHWGNLSINVQVVYILLYYTISLTVRSGFLYFV
ncbi:hypothetical protein ALC60_02020, partial [Trachymyrmex zeteki]